MTFDPQYTWLGIAPSEQPADDYRLLGVARFEPSPEVIQNAADKLIAFLRTKASGPNAEHSQQLLNQVAAAAARLLDAESKQLIDAELKQPSSNPSLDPPDTPLESPPKSPPNAPPIAPPADEAVRRIALRPTTVLLALGGSLLLIVAGAAFTWMLYSASIDNASIDRPSTPSKLTPANAPFGEAQARTHQAAWAEELGREMTITNSIGMQLKLIPPGQFKMGSPRSERFRNNNETQFPARISKHFYLGAFEVTQAQFETVMDDNPSHFRGPYRPVENVSFEDAVEFCRKLSSLLAEESAGRSYRLPSEAEWELACRAGAERAFSFDANLFQLGDCAWFKPNAAAQTHDVGGKLANPWGLHDMHGNVSEWCQDWYAEYPSELTTDPRGPQTGLGRIARGGTWRARLSGCRSASRARYFPSDKLPTLGFRVVAEIE